MQVVKGEVVVHFKQGVDPESIDHIIQTFGASVISKQVDLPIFKLRIPDRDPVESFVTTISKDDSVDHAEPNFLVPNP